QLNSFLKDLQKRGIEKMLEGELDGHLGYDKNQISDTSNARNGYSQKKVKTSYGESEIKVPRDRDASFNPMIVPKRGNMVDGIENVIVSLYAKGMTNSDIEEQIREVYNFEVSTSTISRITERVTGDIVACQNRPLEPVYLIVWMDGIVFKVREGSKVINKTVHIFVDKATAVIANSDFLDGLSQGEASQRAIDGLEALGQGKGKRNYRLMDAVFSRQRYWTEPFPMYYVEGLPQVIARNKQKCIYICCDGRRDTNYTYHYR